MFNLICLTEMRKSFFSPRNTALISECCKTRGNCSISTTDVTVYIKSTLEPPCRCIYLDVWTFFCKSSFPRTILGKGCSPGKLFNRSGDINKSSYVKKVKYGLFLMLNKIFCYFTRIHSVYR